MIGAVIGCFCLYVLVGGFVCGIAIGILDDTYEIYVGRVIMLWPILLLLLIAGVLATPVAALGKHIIHKLKGE